MLALAVCGCGDGGGQTDGGPADGQGWPDGDRALEEWPTDKYLGCEQVRAYQLAGDPRMLLLNVVDEEFYDLGHLEGSLKIPWDLLEGRLAEVDRARYLVVYCRRGVRSEPAYTTLEDAGYAHVWVMEGGIERWIDLGYPTVD